MTQLINQVHKDVTQSEASLAKLYDVSSESLVAEMMQYDSDEARLSWYADFYDAFRLPYAVAKQQANKAMNSAAVRAEGKQKATFEAKAWRKLHKCVSARLKKEHGFRVSCPDINDGYTESERATAFEIVIIEDEKALAAEAAKIQAAKDKADAEAAEAAEAAEKLKQFQAQTADELAVDLADQIRQWGGDPQSVIASLAAHFPAAQKRTRKAA